jgi:uncharacterized protein (TIGR02145 family)
VVALVLSCSTDTPGEANRHSAQINMKVVESSLVSRLVSAVLSVYSDGELVYSDATDIIEGEFAFETFSLPAGIVTIQVIAGDGSRADLYRGTTTTTIAAGALNEIDLTLMPAVPMVKLSPYHQEVTGTFTSTLEIFEIDRFYNGSFRIDYDESRMQFIAASDNYSDDWNDDFIHFVRDEEGELILSISRTGDFDQVPTGVHSVVDLNFSGLEPGTVKLVPAVDSLEHLNGRVPEYDSIYVDTQTVVVTGGVARRGTIIIDPEPDSIAAPWTVSGPNSYSAGGAGDDTLSGLDPGDYTIVWQDVAGWETPQPDTFTLASGATATCGCAYVPISLTGTIVIDPEPDSINAPWTLEGPNDYITSGSGDVTLTDLAVGEYTITWEEVNNWEAPEAETLTLADDLTVTFECLYEFIPLTGTIIIDAEPDSINAPWTLEGPNDYGTSGSGDMTLSDLTIGDYTITWEVVPDWITPPEETQSLVADVTITFDGVYLEDFTGTLTDIDGNVYQTVMIGDQEWMAENLRVTHYRNSDPIPHVTDGGAWSGLSTGAYCEYDNNPSHVETYGRLYNWYAVDDSRNIAPAGWHVPSDDEWKQLEMYLGMSQAEADAVGSRGTDEGGKLKESGTTHWSPPNEGATNERGFTALPGGNRSYDGDFNYVGSNAGFWCSTEYNSSNAWYRGLSHDGSQVYRFSSAKRDGISVRCVRD